MNINDNRSLLLKDYRLNKNKKSLKQLIITFLPNIQRIIQKFEYLNIEDILTSIAIEAAIDCINKFDLKNDVENLNSYIHKYVKCRIEIYLKKKEEFSLEFETLPINGENGTSYDMDFVLNKILVKQMLEYLYEQNPISCEIIKLRYGIGSNHPMTLEEIAKIKNISFQAVEKREDKALKLLNKRFGSYI